MQYLYNRRLVLNKERVTALKADQFLSKLQIIPL